LVTPLPQRGTTEALWAAIQAPPHVTAEDVAELEANFALRKSANAHHEISVVIAEISW
jgi:hypothetical protein